MYQKTKNNPYLLPHNLYMKITYLIRDYDRMNNIQQDLLLASGDNMVRVKNTAKSSSTEYVAIRIGEISRQCGAVENALDQIPPEYHNGLLNNICKNYPYPYTAHYNTYRYNRYKLMYLIAKELGEI